MEARRIRRWWFACAILGLALALLFEVLLQIWTPRNGHYRFAYFALLLFTPVHAMTVLLTALFVAPNPARSWHLRFPALELSSDVSGGATKLAQVAVLLALFVIPSGFVVHDWLKFYHGSAFVRGDCEKRYPDAHVVNQGQKGDHARSCQIYRAMHFTYVPMAEAFDGRTSRLYRYGWDNEESTVPIPKMTYVPFWGPLALAVWTGALTLAAVLVLTMIFGPGPDRHPISRPLRAWLFVRWFQIPRPSRGAPPSDDVFVSYATEDRDAVESLERDLQAHDLSVWRDASRIAPGQDFVIAIQAALGQCRVAVVWVSPAFLRKEWGRQEARLLYELFAGQEGRLIPVWDGVTRQQVEAVEPALSRIHALTSDDEELIVKIAQQVEAQRRNPVPKYQSVSRVFDTGP